MITKLNLDIINCLSKMLIVDFSVLKSSRQHGIERVFTKSNLAMTQGTIKSNLFTFLGFVFLRQGLTM